MLPLVAFFPFLLSATHTHVQAVPMLLNPHVPNHPCSLSQPVMLHDKTCTQSAQAAHTAIPHPHKPVHNLYQGPNTRLCCRASTSPASFTQSLYCATAVLPVYCLRTGAVLQAVLEGS